MQRQVSLKDGTVSQSLSAAPSELSVTATELVNTFGPEYRMLLIGAGQLTEYLATMALFSGFAVTVCDPREEYRSAWSVAGAVVLSDMPDDVVNAFKPDRRSCVIALTHDPKLDDLALAQSDMQNLLNSTDIATLFLDGALHVRRYTEQITRLIHLRPGDIGRPLSDLATTLVYPQLEDDARETLRSLNFVEKQVSTQSGQWYQVRIKPYRTLANLIQGVVITFIDITAAKELEARLRSG